MAFSARLLRFLCVFIIFIALTPHTTFAQSNQAPYQQAEQTSKQVQILITGFSGTLICTLSGIDIFHPGYTCLGQKIQPDGNSSSQINTQPLGVLGFVTGGLGALYQKPISGEESIKYLASNFGIAKQTLAQTPPAGGFQAFSFMQDMFLRIRDISFLFLVFAFILIGIAIMLRFKIDPRTVMTLQNQIPKIIVGIVMITFSYTIAGALVDGMWLLTYFGINTLGSISQSECGNVDTTGSNSPTFAGVGTQQLLNNPVAFTSHVFSDAGCQGSFDGIGGLSYDIGSSMSTGITSAILQAIGLNVISPDDCSPSLFHPDVTDCLQKGIYSFLSFLIGIVAFLIVLIAILVALIRLWITLIKAYVYIILDVLTAPLQILLGILPGGRMGFTKWLRHITGYLLLFPASAFIIFLALAFTLNTKLNQATVDPTQVFFPPLIGVPGSSGKIGYLIAFGLIMLLPEILEMIKEAMQIKGNARVSSSIVGGLGRGVGPSMALGGLTGGLFGKDKGGLPQPGRMIAGQIWNSKYGLGRRSDNRVAQKLGAIYRTQDRYNQSKDKNLRQSREWIKQGADSQYQYDRSHGVSHQEAEQKRIKFLDENNYYMKKTDKTITDSSSGGPGRGNSTGTSSPSKGDNSPTSPSGVAGAAAVPHANIHVPGDTSSHESPETHSPSAEGNSTSTSAAGHTPVGGPTSSSTHTPQLKIKVKWFGDELKREDGTGGTVAKRISPDTFRVTEVTTMGTREKDMRQTEFNQWINERYELVVS
jgi:hypothetical protein